MAFNTAISQYKEDEKIREWSTGFHTCESIRKKGGKSRELKHLSTDEEKSTESPKVVASEIGKTCSVEEKSNREV